MENFHFKGFIPSETLRLRADRAMDRILELAPSDATITAAMEQEGGLFYCAIELGSTSCPLAVETSHKIASLAVDKAELTMIRKLNKWRGARFILDDSAPMRAPLRFAT